MIQINFEAGNEFKMTSSAENKVKIFLNVSEIFLSQRFKINLKVWFKIFLTKMVPGENIDILKRAAMLALKNDEQDWKVKTARQLKIHIFLMKTGTKELFWTDLLNRDEQCCLRIWITI